jgi:hypothetical protein
MSASNTSWASASRGTAAAARTKDAAENERLRARDIRNRRPVLFRRAGSRRRLNEYERENKLAPTSGTGIFGASDRRSEPQATNKRSPSRSTSGQGSGAGDTVMVSNSSSPANAAGATLPNFVASTSKCFSKAAAIAACLIATS